MDPAGFPADIRGMVQNALDGQAGGDAETNIFAIKSARALEFLYGDAGMKGGRRHRTQTLRRRRARRQAQRRTRHRR